jgi:flagellin
MIATVENATNDVTDMLHRIRELAVQAANDTNSSTDRGYLQKEVDSLLNEINRVAAQTVYNGAEVLDGSRSGSSNKQQIQVGTDSGQSVSFEISAVDTDTLLLTAGIFTASKDQVSVNAIKTDATDLADSTTFFVRNASTGVNTSFATGTTHNQHEYSTLINNALGTVEGTAAVRVTSTAAASFSTAIYYLKQESTGDVFKLSVSNGNTAAEWQTALSNAVRYGGDFDAEAKNLTTNNDVTASLTGTKVQFVGDRLFGDFNIYSDATLNTNIADQTHANHKVGVEGTGIAVRTADGTTNADADFIATAADNAQGTTDVTLGGNAGVAAIGTEDTEANGGATLIVAQQITITSGGDDSGTTVTVEGTNADGSVISETLTAGATAAVTTINRFKTVTAVTMGAASAGTVTVGVEGTSTTYTYKGAREFGDFDISTAASGGTVQTTDGTTGDADSKDLALAAAAGNDTATIQGTISLKSSKLFSVTQSSAELTANDNYFTTQASSLNTVSNIDLRSQSGASLAIATLDGAIEKISSMRSDLGAIENRLDHTVNNLMNVAEQTEAARSRIQDADFASESAKLAKAQVLKQAGVGMLAQANASSQLVLQLLQ